MSTSSDLKIGEAIKHRVLIIETATGNAWAGQNPLVTIIDESGNQAVAAAATEESNGWYFYSFTPDAAGTWTSSWALAGATFYHSPLMFKVGSANIGGLYDLANTEIADIKTKTDNLPVDPADDSDIDAQLVTIDALHDVPAQNAVANVVVRDVVGNKTDTTAGDSLVALAKQIKAKTDNLPADPADDSDIDGQLATIDGNVDTIVADTPYIADAALPAAPTAGSLGSRFTGVVVLETTIAADGRSTTGARLSAGSDNNSAYVNMLAVMDSDAGDFEYVSRTITAYTGATKQLTWTPAITEDAHQGGKIWIVANDTKVNVTCDAISTALSTVDGFHDVPAQNSAANSQMRDVVGNKTDTTAGNSIYALLKQIVEDTGTTLDDLVDDLETRLTAARAGYLDKLANRLQTVTFFSPCQTEVVADTTHTDASMPTVTIPNWTGTIVHVYAGFLFRMIENTNAAANKLSGAQEIQVNKAGGAWADAIHLVDDQFGIAASTREGGTMVMGYTDLVGTIDVFNTTAQFQWDEPLTDQTALHFNDVQTFVVIQYY